MRTLRLPTISPRAYARITLFALIAVGFIIVTGAAVRLTGSGLGCSQWPTCESDRVIAPLELHPMIEFVNRMITGLVSAAVIVAVLGSLIRSPRRRDLTWWSLGLVGGVLAQIVLGGISVRVGLRPPFITAHFLASIVLVWNAMVLHHRAAQPDTPAEPIVAGRVVWLGRTLVTLSLLVLVTGTLVTGTGPHAGDERAPRYDFLPITDISRIHSLTMWLFLGVTAFTLWRLRRDGAPAQVDQRGRTLVAAIVAQGVLGYAQYASGVPPYLVIVHVLGSVLVFVATLAFHFGLFTHPAAALDLADAAVGTGTAGVAPVSPTPDGLVTT